MKGDKMKGHKPVPRPNPLDRLNCGPVKFSGSNDPPNRARCNEKHIMKEECHD